MPLHRFHLGEPATHMAGRTPDQLLFIAPQGGPLRSSNFRSRFFDPAVRAAGLGHLHLTPYKLRHTAASLAITGGADVNVIRTMLGHKSAALTLDVYGHLFADRLDEVSDKMDERRTTLLAKARTPHAKPLRPQGGRRRYGDREVLAAILFVATTGCTWRQLPPVFGPSRPTAHRRFTE